MTNKNKSWTTIAAITAALCAILGALYAMLNRKSEPAPKQIEAPQGHWQPPPAPTYQPPYNRPVPNPPPPPPVPPPPPLPPPPPPPPPPPSRLHF